MRKNKHAVNLGRLGGKATARNLTKDQRKANAQRAAIIRWERWRIIGKDAQTEHYKNVI